MKQSFELAGNDPDEILGLRDNKEEINIIPGEVIGGLRGGSPEYFESVEEQIEELRLQREAMLQKLLEKALDVAPGTGLFYPLFKGISGNEISGKELSAGERLAMISQFVALSVAYGMTYAEIMGDGGPGVVSAALTGKFAAIWIQLRVNQDDIKEVVMNKFREFSESHPGYSILLDHIKNGFNTLPEAYFNRGVDNLEAAVS